MPARETENLVEYWSRCHECGAPLATVPGGAVCPLCGFELEDPLDETLLFTATGRCPPGGGMNPPR